MKKHNDNSEKEQKSQENEEKNIIDRDEDKCSEASNVLQELYEEKIHKLRRKRRRHFVVGCLFLVYGIAVNLFYHNFAKVVIIGVSVLFGSICFLGLIILNILEEKELREDKNGTGSD